MSSSFTGREGVEAQSEQKVARSTVGRKADFKMRFGFFIGLIEKILSGNVSSLPSRLKA